MFAGWMAGMVSILLMFSLYAWGLTAITGSAKIGLVPAVTVFGVAFAIGIWVYRIVSRWFDRRYGAK